MIANGGICGVGLTGLGIECVEYFVGPGSFALGLKAGSLFAAVTWAAIAGCARNGNNPNEATIPKGKLAGAAVACALHSYSNSSFTASLIMGGDCGL
jgi:hypothetical protein